MRRSALLAVCLAVFIDMLGFGIILPSLPLHAADLGGGGAWVGVLLTGYAAAQFVAAPILGSLSDRYGRRRLLLLSLAGSAVSLTVTAVAGSLALLLLARVVAGGFGGATAVGQAYVIDLSPARQRTRALGLVGASIGLGFVFGPAIGAGLAGLGVDFAGTCFVAAGVAVANLVLGLIRLPGPAARPPTRRGRPTGPRRSAPLRRIATLRAGLSRPTLRPVLLALFGVTFAFVGMETTFALLARSRFNLGPAGLGIVFAGVGIVMVIVQGGLVSRLTDRYGDAPVALAGAVVLAVGLLALPNVPAAVGYPALGLVAIGQGLLSPTTASLLARGGGGNLGGLLGVGQSAAAAARAVGPLVAGLAFALRPAAPYLIGAVASLGAAALLWTVRSGETGDDPPPPTPRRPARTTGRAEQLLDTRP